MKRIATIASGLKARHLAALLSLAAPSASLAQAFNNTDSVLNPAATTVSSTLVPTGGFFRISNITGLDGTSVVAANISESPTATDFTATANYLSRLGSFTFANDYPIRNVSLSVSVDSIYDPASGGIGGLSDDTNTGQFNRTAFRIHDFSLLFVGSTGEQFLVSRNTTFASLPGVSGDQNFVVTVNSGTREPGLVYDAGGTSSRTDQIQSLEWLSGSLPFDDGGWDTGTDPIENLDDTFPTTADIGPGAAQADDPTVTLERGFNTFEAPPLYAGGAGETIWNVYLFSTGELSGPTAGYQLNLSQIIIAVELPESSHALWGGLALLGTAEVLRRRRHAP